jgi:hypothetical protein
VVAGADLGVLTISEVNMSAEGIANRGEASAAIQIRAQGELMEAGTLKVLMSIPITPPEFSLHYSGSVQPFYRAEACSGGQVSWQMPNASRTDNVRFHQFWIAGIGN